MERDYAYKPPSGKCESYDLVNEKYIPCGKTGTRRMDNGLDSGIHCEKHWKNLVSDCRKRSW
jgi:hypothetical protein